MNWRSWRTVKVLVGSDGHGQSSSRSSRAIVTRRSTCLFWVRLSGRRTWSSTSGARTMRSHWDRSTGAARRAGVLGDRFADARAVDMDPAGAGPEACSCSATKDGRGSRHAEASCEDRPDVIERGIGRRRRAPRPRRGLECPRHRGRPAAAGSRRAAGGRAGAAGSAEGDRGDPRRTCAPGPSGRPPAAARSRGSSGRCVA